MYGPKASPRSLVMARLPDKLAIDSPAINPFVLTVKTGSIVPLYLALLSADIVNSCLEINPSAAEITALAPPVTK